MLFYRQLEIQLSPSFCFWFFVTGSPIAQAGLPLTRFEPLILPPPPAVPQPTSSSFCTSCLSAELCVCAEVCVELVFYDIWQFQQKACFCFCVFPQRMSWKDGSFYCLTKWKIYWVFFFSLDMINPTHKTSWPGNFVWKKVTFSHSFRKFLTWLC